MKTAINNAKIFDGEKVIYQKGSVLFDESGILEISETPFDADQVVDAGGKTLTPGLIDGHVHLGDAGISPMTSEKNVIEAAAHIAASAQEVWKYGITTMCNCATANNIDLVVRDMIKTGAIPGCRIVASGKGISITGGHGWPINYQCDDDLETLKAARSQLRDGADFVKLFATGGMATKGSIPNAPQLTESQMRVASEYAEQLGSFTRAHATGLEGAQRAIRAGVHIIDHTQLDEETAQMMADAKAVYCPTIVTRYNIIHSTDPAYAFMRAKANPGDLDRKKRALELCREKGIMILAGTDGGTGALTPLGSSFWTELNIYTEYALTCEETLRAATADAAKALKIDKQTGKISVGLSADLALFDGDPTQDMADIRSLNSTYQGGKLVFRNI